jgi:AcrR family transcriptional regulator
MFDASGEDRPEPPAETYNDLMEAGYAALIEHGYADLSLRKIAAESEKSHSLLQHYYGDKQGVVVELLLYLIDGYLEDVTATEGPDPDPTGRLRTDLRRSLLGPADEDSRFWAFQTALFELRLVAREDSTIRQQFERGEARVVERFADDVRAGIEAGVFREVDPERVALQFRDLVDAARLRRVVMGETEAPERTQWFIEQFVLPGLLATGTSEPSE